MKEKSFITKISINATNMHKPHWPDRNAVLSSRQCLLHIIFKSSWQTMILVLLKTIILILRYFVLFRLFNSFVSLSKQTIHLIPKFRRTYLRTYVQQYSYGDLNIIWSRHCLDASTSFLCGQCVYIWVKVEYHKIIWVGMAYREDIRRLLSL
jgi:hypothetical protein